MWATLLGFQDAEIVGSVGPNGISFYTQMPTKVLSLSNPSAFLSPFAMNSLMLYQMQAHSKACPLKTRFACL